MAPASKKLKTEPTPEVAIFNFGSQFTHLIARRTRELKVYCEVYDCETKADAFEGKAIKGIILSGGPASVYAKDAPHVDASVWKFIEDNKVPVLGTLVMWVHFGGLYGT